MSTFTKEERDKLENVTATGRRDPNIANSIDFLTGMPIDFFDDAQGLPSALTQGEGYQTGLSADVERQIAEGLAIQRAQHEKKLKDEIEEELSDALEGEAGEGVELALDEAGENLSLVDKLIQSTLETPTAGIRALNNLLGIVPGTGRLTGGIENLLDAPGLILGDALARSPLGRAIDEGAMPVASAGERAIGSAKDRVSAFGDRFDAVVNPVEMVLRGLKILNDPIGAATDIAFKTNPEARRLVELALEGTPEEMAQGGAVMNYNDPLMMRSGGSTRRRRRRRGGVDSLMARRRRLSPADARRQQRREEVIEREAGPMVPLGGAAGSPHDPFRNKPGMLEAKYRSDQRARERQQQDAIREAVGRGKDRAAGPPLEQRRLPDNRAAIEQRMVDERAARDSYQPFYYGPTERARDAAIKRYQKSLNMQEDLAGGPLAASPTPVTGGDQIRFGPGGQPMPQREPLQDPGGGGYRLGTGYEPQRGQPGYRPPSPQSQVRDQRARYMPERRGPQQMPGSERDIQMRRRVEELRRIGDLKRNAFSGPMPDPDYKRSERPLSGWHGGWHGGRAPGETFPGEPTELPLPQLPGQQPPMPDSVQQMLDYMGAQQDRLGQSKQEYQEQQQPQLPDSVLQMLAEMGNQQERLDSFKQPDPLQQLMDDLEMRKRKAQYDAAMPRRNGGMIYARR